jgi:hypothetical protein
MKSALVRTADAQIGRYMVQAKMGVQSVRSLRDAIIQLAYQLAECPSKRALLVLPNLQVTKERLSEEQAKALQAFRPEITKRLYLVTLEGEEFLNLPARLSASHKRRLQQLVRSETTQHGERLQRIDGYYVILKLLILQWLNDAPPMTTKWLSETSGYSYPTVAKTLSRLAGNVKRHSNRRVELRLFPWDEWARLLAVSDQVRSTVWFTDTSGQPRELETLTRRLNELNRCDIALGGVYGARHYHPGLNLVGSPRLDLTMHCPQGTRDLAFVKQLDPGLEKIEGPGRPARLVVHAARRTKSFFESREGGLSWADPVECLLDLHEAHLEPQALEILNTLIARRGKRP